MKARRGNKRESFAGELWGSSAVVLPSLPRLGSYCDGQSLPMPLLPKKRSREVTECARASRPLWLYVARPKAMAISYCFRTVSHKSLLDQNGNRILVSAFAVAREEDDLTCTGDGPHRQAVISGIIVSSTLLCGSYRAKGVADAQALRPYGVYRVYYDGGRCRPLSRR
jgi:hypothetical protein